MLKCRRALRGCQREPGRPPHDRFAANALLDLGVHLTAVSHHDNIPARLSHADDDITQGEAADIDLDGDSNAPGAMDTGAVAQ